MANDVTLSQTSPAASRSQRVAFLTFDFHAVPERDVVFDLGGFGLGVRVQPGRIGLVLPTTHIY